MFLYLLNEEEGKAFMELATIALKINGEEKDCELAEYEAYLTELSLPNYKAVGLSLEDAASVFKFSSMPTKRSVLIELCGILYADKEIDSDELKWIHKLAKILKVPSEETDRLVRWSKDFSDFLEVGLLYINAK